MAHQKMLENAHKITFLVKQYPDHKLNDLLKLIVMPAVEINTGLWYAQDLGLIEPPAEDGTLALIKTPESWYFGDQVEALQDMILYALQKLATKEQDLEENYLSNWTMGYSPQDHMIALATLINDGKVASYTLADPDDLQSIYTFYTLTENVDKVWGRQNFKKEPVQEKDMPTNDTGDTAEKEPTDEK